MRFAGTARQYSTKAIAQLATIARKIGADLNFRCPYYAIVMKTFEKRSSTTGASHAGRILAMGNPLRKNALP